MTNLSQDIQHYWIYGFRSSTMISSASRGSGVKDLHDYKSEIVKKDLIRN